MSCARAIDKHLTDWLRLPSYNASPVEVASEIFSMGILSDGNTYGIPPGLVFSFPCRHFPLSLSTSTAPGVGGGEVVIEVVEGLVIDAYTQSLLDITVKELQEEREAAAEYL